MRGYNVSRVTVHVRRKLDRIAETRGERELLVDQVAGSGGDALRRLARL